MKKKTWIKIGVWAAALAVALTVGYLVIFRHADELKIVDGRMPEAKASWLIGSLPDGEGQARYYKLATVGAPRNYTADKTAADPDGDPFTTFFAYAGRDPEKSPGKILVQPVGMPLEAAAQGQGAARGTVGTQEGFLALSDSEAGHTLRFWMASPYADMCIFIQITLPADASDEALTGLCQSMLEHVTPGKKLSPLAAAFKLNFIDDNRWQFLANGLKVTLEITLGAVVMGILIGVAVAAVRSSWDQNAESLRPGPGRIALSLLNRIAKIYLTVIRGTPVLIQLMIIYYVIFASSRNGLMVSILAFGINSGAYVAEIIRSGITSIDPGQFEAGRSLGFNYVQTMAYIVLPQALKNVLPALANEFIALLKETSVSGYVAVKDLTKGGDIIQAATYSPFLPLLAVAAIYLVLVMFFTWLVGKLERRLKNSER